MHKSRQFCTTMTTLFLFLTCTDALEHAAWTKGSRHMQPLRDDFNWFQHSSLDVLLFLTAIVIVLLSLVAVIVLYVIRKTYEILVKKGHRESSHSKTA